MKKDYLLREPPMKALCLFAFPMILGNLFQQGYAMADSMVLGRCVGENALAAVGASYSLTNVFICIAIGGGLGASVLVGRYFGARNYERMRLTIFVSLLSFLLLSFFLAALGLAFGREFMIWLKTPEEILDMAVTYLKVYFLGLPFLFLYNVLSAMFNALGRSRIPLYFLIFSSLFNILLDLYLVKEAGMGILGVALATLMAQGSSALLSFFLFLWEVRAYVKDQDANPEKDFAQRPSHHLLRELFSIGRVALPSILQQSTVSIGVMLVQSVVNGFGPQMLAGYSAGSRVESLCIVPMAALGSAMSSYTAQNLGAGQTERVEKGYTCALRLTGIFALALCLILELFHLPIIAAFLGEDGTKTALSTGSSYLRFIGFFFALIGLKMTTDGLLRGSAHMKLFTLANLANLALRVLLAALLAPRFGIAFVWYAVPLGWLVNFLISFWGYKKGYWKKRPA